MKITQSQLKEIIKEELSIALKEKKIEEAELLDEGALKMLGQALPMLRNLMIYGPWVMKFVKFMKSNPKALDKIKDAGDSPPTGAPAPDTKAAAGGKPEGAWWPGMD